MTIPLLVMPCQVVALRDLEVGWTRTAEELELWFGLAEHELKKETAVAEVVAHLLCRGLGNA